MMNNRKMIYLDDAIDAIKDLPNCPNGYSDTYDKARIISVLEEVPPAQEWTLCTETVDIPDHEVLACDKYGEEILGYLEYADDQWICENEDWTMYDPIAWMEKPESYTERRQDDVR